MKEKVQRFMTGRYGFDELSKVCLVVTITLMAVSMFVRNQIPYLLARLLLFYSYIRAFTRKTEKRRQENQRFLSLRYRAVVKWNTYKNHRAQKKIYRFYKCPQCRQKVRVPKGKGKICITCPKCRAEFVKNS